jgi:hypothetical protein
VPGWPRRCKLAYAVLWEYSICYKRLKLARVLGRHGAFLTLGRPPMTPAAIQEVPSRGRWGQAFILNVV